MRPFGANSAGPWFDATWLRENWRDLATNSGWHALWSLEAFAVGLVVAALLVVLARSWRRVEGSLRVVSLIASSVPAVGVVVGLFPSVRSRPVLIAATATSVAALVFRGTMHGVDRADPDVVQEAAALGYGRWSRLARVEFPLAALVIRSGIRCASVAAIGLVAIAGNLWSGGLGPHLISGQQRAERLAGLVVLAALALVADSLIRLAIRVPGRGTWSSIEE